MNLDAPRHFFLHSHRSLKDVAALAGLTIDRLWCDSSDMQFMASEQYEKDIPLTDPRSATITKRDGIFSRAQRRAYVHKAKEVNQALRGDTICAVMSRNVTLNCEDPTDSDTTGLPRRRSVALPACSRIQAVMSGNS